MCSAYFLSGVAMGSRRHQWSVLTPTTWRFDANTRSAAKKRFLCPRTHIYQGLSPRISTWILSPTRSPNRLHFKLADCSVLPIQQSAARWRYSWQAAADLLLHTALTISSSMSRPLTKTMSSRELHTDGFSHDVVFTVRSHEKGKYILSNHPGLPQTKLSYIIVEDIAKRDAFKDAVKSTPPFEAVLHTASPFHFRSTNVQNDLVDPAIIGTTGILESIKASAPTVKIVVITSSFAAMVNTDNPPKIYDETCWNPVTVAQAVDSPNTAYRVGKT